MTSQNNTNQQPSKPSFAKHKRITDDNKHELYLENEPEVISNAKQFDELLKRAWEFGASDINIQTNRPIKVEIYGDNFNLTRHSISPVEMTEILKILLGEGGSAKANDNIPMNSGYAAKFQILHENARTYTTDSFRFRVNSTVEKQGGSITHQITMRLIPTEIPHLEDMDLPPELEEALLDPAFGMFFITGPTGSGKTTLMAAVIGHLIRKNESLKITTAENPIEFDFSTLAKEKEHIVISQSEVPTDIISFAKATDNILRRATDIGIVGESSSAETLKEAVAVSTKGHKLFTTLHTNSFPSTLRTMVSFFPLSEQGALLFDIIENSNLFLSQILVKCEDPKKGGRVALREWVIFNEPVREILRNGGIDRLSETSKIVLQKYGHSFAQDAKEKFEAGYISEDTYNRIVKKYNQMNEGSKQEKEKNIQFEILDQIKKLSERQMKIEEQQNEIAAQSLLTQKALLAFFEQEAENEE